jgi:hypothetical protein
MVDLFSSLNGEATIANGLGIRCVRPKHKNPLTKNAA